MTSNQDNNFEQVLAEAVLGFEIPESDYQSIIKAHQSSLEEAAHKSWLKGYEAGQAVVSGKMTGIDSRSVEKRIRVPLTKDQGVVGKVYGIVITHQNNIGDPREHINPPELCWCWDA